MTLYQSGIAPDGKPLMAGLFRLKDEEGFPIDMSYEQCKEHGWHPDWAEALADAGSQGIEKYDALLQELGFLLGEDQRNDIVNKFALWAAKTYAAHPEDGFVKVCERLMQEKK